MTLAHPKPVRRKRVPEPIRRRSGGPRRKKGVRKVRKTSRAKMGRLADKLFSLIVRAGGICLEHGADTNECAGVLQCAHIRSRAYRSTRWDEDNAFALCAGAHKYYTHHPLEFEDFVIMRIGDDAFAELKRRALRRWDGDIEGVLVRLAARAVSLGLKPEGK